MQKLKEKSFKNLRLVFGREFENKQLNKIKLVFHVGRIQEIEF